MGTYSLIGNKHDEVPFYLVDDTTFALDDSALLADMAAEHIGAPIGTYITKAGLKAIKQLGTDGSFTAVVEEPAAKETPDDDDA